MFSHAIVRTPSKNLINGLSSANLGFPNFAIALKQHQVYISALQKCGLEVIKLPPLDNFPDSCFVEDTAVVNEKVAIITRPGAESRRGEENSIATELQKIYPHLEYITEPGTLEGGDIMRIENHYYIGLSNRTNSIGAKQLIKNLQQYGYEGSVVPLKEMLHLKTGVNYLGNNIILVSGEFITHKEFQKFEKIIVQPEEAYAANCVRINDFILMPAGFPKLKDELLKKEFQIVELEMSEFQKLDGGLSCLSLRF